MAGHQKKLPDTPEGDQERLKRAAKRCRRVLETKVAQSPLAPKLGMEFKFLFELNPKTGENRLTGRRIELPEPEDLAYAAMQARPFTLFGEEIHASKLANSLLRGIEDEGLIAAVRQIERMWNDAPLSRYTHFSATRDGEWILPKEGVSNAVIGDRYLYSEIAHADDASDILDHIDTHDQLQAFASLVGDWIAIVSHQESFINTICPEACPELTKWAGDQFTFFERTGMTIPDELRASN